MGEVCRVAPVINKVPGSADIYFGHLCQLKLQMQGYVNFCNLCILAYKFQEPMAKSDAAEAVGFLSLFLFFFFCLFFFPVGGLLE